jgi:hypothetical protein
MSKAWRILFLGVVCAWFVPAKAALDITNINQIVKDLKVHEFKGKSFSRKVRIAVIDNGFYGYEKEIGKTLPENTHYHAGAESDVDKTDNRGLHGLFMSQLLYQILQKSDAKLDVELHLFYALGYTKFADAVKSVIQDKFDIVLYSQVWEYGGNGDGKGFINELVDQAVGQGIVWINAAGNFGRLTRLAPVDGKVEGTDEWVQFKDPMTIKVDCAPKKGEKCSIRLILSWNDFKDDADTGTDKDLDFYLLDSKKRVLQSSERHQKLKQDLSDPMASMFPREFIETSVAPGTYTLKVKVSSKNFSASQDQLRITVSGEGVTMNHPTVGETLLPPADNPGVIVVGASDDYNSNRSVKNGKPDVWLKSLVRLKDGSAPFESSTAAAMAAAVAVLHVGTGTEATRDAVLAKLKTVSRTDGVVDLKKAKPQETVKKSSEDSVADNQSRQPDVRRTRRQTMQLPYMYPAVERLLRDGAGVTYSRGHIAVAVSPGQVDMTRMDDDQIAVISPEGIRFYGPEDLAGGLPANYYPVVVVNK